MGDLIDQTEDLSDLEIGEINRLVCGVHTETCDDSCGGALCKLNDGKAHCGNPSYSLIGTTGNEGQGQGLCEDSAYKMAQRALNHADTAEANLANVKREVDGAMAETEPIRTLAKEAYDSASRVQTDVSTFIKMPISNIFLDFLILNIYKQNVYLIFFYILTSFLVL